MMNPTLNIHWLTHTTNYWVQILSEFDAKGIAITTPGIIKGWLDAMNDIESNYDA